jgi:exodeoxyribonuclease VII small subunit
MTLKQDEGLDMEGPHLYKCSTSREGSGNGCDGIGAMTTETRIDEVGFEAALRQLEQTVEDLEAGELGLDGALAKYELGVRLLAHCYGLLDGAEQRVALLTELDEAGRPGTIPFDVSAVADREAPFEADGMADPSAGRRATLSPSSDGEGDLPF